MTKYTFKQKDFKVFSVEGLENRMQALDEQVRPQLHALGERYTKYLTEQTGDTFHYHVAKHARRTVNPPKDTWVAFATNQRGYKMLPHFQIGLFESQLFIMFGVMHENKNKGQMADFLNKNFNLLEDLPSDYSLCFDHYNIDKSPIDSLSTEDLKHHIKRLKDIKKAEFFVTRTLDPKSDVLKTDKSFTAFLDETFEELIKFYS
ncbi:DUF1054 domain-containing protein [Mammaliicoccus sciuri]|uniref:YktB family protein n=1 Tax=Mammaliicoccus sciuri TaxID=1296 RepID=UPI000E67989B|nr:DUF1054 domain-containing protein [Mammaliicoccus sciuri]MEB6301402.1 DUF1054 domain-containing protein [Mammaliicoccus sciuri]RIO07652.1 DUF1054 domain-containing protein [Mammaliicoccus sciuri]